MSQPTPIELEILYCGIIQSFNAVTPLCVWPTEASSSYVNFSVDICIVFKEYFRYFCNF